MSRPLGIIFNLFESVNNVAKRNHWQHQRTEPLLSGFAGAVVEDDGVDLDDDVE
jgi:hypothetical protein